MVLLQNLIFGKHIEKDYQGCIFNFIWGMSSSEGKLLRYIQNVLFVS